jgi:transcriptional regulator NrdR family protein
MGEEEKPEEKPEEEKPEEKPEEEKPEEKPEEELKVQKKKGTTEPFMVEKIKSGIVKAGGTVELAGETALKVAGWAKETAKEGIVTTVEIQKKVIELLAETNEDIATAFQQFVKKI